MKGEKVGNISPYENESVSVLNSAISIFTKPPFLYHDFNYSHSSTTI